MLISLELRKRFTAVKNDVIYKALSQALHSEQLNKFCAVVRPMMDDCIAAAAGRADRRANFFQTGFGKSCASARGAFSPRNVLLSHSRPGRQTIGGFLSHSRPPQGRAAGNLPHTHSIARTALKCARSAARFTLLGNKDDSQN